MITTASTGAATTVAPAARGAAWRCVLPGAALAALLGLLSGCASAPSAMNDGMAAGEVDYAARHERMLKVVLERRIRTIWKFSTVAEVDGDQACSAEMMVMPG